MRILDRIKSLLRRSRAQEQSDAAIDLSDPNTKRILDKQYTDEELEIKQMLKDIDTKKQIVLRLEYL